MAAKAPTAASRAGQAIERQTLALESTRLIGRPLPDDAQLRELVIPFGDSVYVALCRHDPDDDIVFVLAFRRQNEAGY